ncbi:MAG: OsmC family protein [Candidatus Glassbacteria bacterium]|nr:OsmC family protein [Candidatus Glassbacteria bacterium]
MAKARWVEGFQFVGTPPSNHAIVLDGSAKAGGADSAIHPGELLLVGLAGCTGIDVISMLRKMKVEVDEFEVRVEGEAAEEHPKYWKKLNVTYWIRGKDIPEDKLQKAISLSQEKYCSVSATLKNKVEVTYGHEIEKTD